MRALWWFAVLVWLFAVIPLVGWLLARLLRPVEQIRRSAEDILAHGDGLAAALAETDRLGAVTDEVARFAAGVRRYAGRPDTEG